MLVLSKISFKSIRIYKKTLPVGEVSDFQTLESGDTKWLGKKVQMS